MTITELFQLCLHTDTIEKTLIFTDIKVLFLTVLFYTWLVRCTISGLQSTKQAVKLYLVVCVGYHHVPINKILLKVAV